MRSTTPVTTAPTFTRSCWSLTVVRRPRRRRARARARSSSRCDRSSSRRRGSLRPRSACRRAVLAELGDVEQPFDGGREPDEAPNSVMRTTVPFDDAALDDVELGPGIGGERLERERDLLRRARRAVRLDVLHLADLHLDGVAGLERVGDRRRCDRARSPERGISPSMPPRSTNAPKSRTPVTVPRRTAPGTMSLMRAVRGLARLALEERRGARGRRSCRRRVMSVTRNSQRLADERLRVFVLDAARIDLRHRAERARAGELDLEAALVHAGDLALDAEPAALRLLERGDAARLAQRATEADDALLVVDLDDVGGDACRRPSR